VKLVPGAVAIAPLSAADGIAWRLAYGDYAIDVDSPVDDAIAARVWTWLLDPAHPLEGIAAYVGTTFAGFAHYRPFPRTLDGNEAGFLDDLWVAAPFRGTGVVHAIFARLEAIARERGWTHIRWVTQTENARARRLYDSIARPIEILTYRLDTSDRR
jgi:GNAT superfamily N-acetyltransferase